MHHCPGQFVLHIAAGPLILANTTEGGDPMPDPTLIKDAQDFFTSLARDNTKAWWSAHKETYDARIKAPALDLIAAMTPRLATGSGHPVAGKLFRPHRDVRFSKDKTPYNTHLHMMWTFAASGRQDPVFFFGIAPEHVTVGAGVTGFDKPVLEDWRRMVDLDQIRIGTLMATSSAAGFMFREPELKRVPAPYPADHPLADLLRSKGLVVRKDLGGTGDLADRLMAEFAAALPVLRMLDSIL